MTDQATGRGLEFTAKYDADHAAQYFDKHRSGLRRRLTTWRERQLVTRALELAGNPTSVLDLPAGAGRFWPVLARVGRELVAFDTSIDMLRAGRAGHAGTAPGLAAADAFRLPLADGAVDTVVCMRLLHHLPTADDRLALLRELRRVTRRRVLVSLWVDGNYQARQRQRREQRRGQRRYRNRICLPVAQVEAEFAAAGLRPLRHFDVLPRIAMWRLYLLSK